MVEVVGYTDSKETRRTMLATAGDPVALTADADRSELRSTFGDLAYVTLNVVDGEDRVVKWADPEISVNVRGAGDLAALGTADPASSGRYADTRQNAWRGSLTAVVRCSGVPGEIVLTATAEGLAPVEIRLTAA